MAAVPQIEGLTVEDMLELVKTSATALRHLPDERDWDHMDRKWLSDIIYTTERAKFEKTIKDAVKARKERLEDKNHLLVEMRPEFAAAFQNCMSFSRKPSKFADSLFSREWSRLQLNEIFVKAKENQGGT